MSEAERAQEIAAMVEKIEASTKALKALLAEPKIEVIIKVDQHALVKPGLTSAQIADIARQVGELLRKRPRPPAS